MGQERYRSSVCVIREDSICTMIQSRSSLIKQTVLASAIWLAVGWAMYDRINTLSGGHLSQLTQVLIIGFVVLVPIVLVVKAFTGRDINITRPSTRETVLEDKTVLFSQLLFNHRLLILLVFVVAGFLIGVVSYFFLR